MLLIAMGRHVTEARRDPSRRRCALVRLSSDIAFEPQVRWARRQHQSQTERRMNYLTTFPGVWVVWLSVLKPAPHGLGLHRRCDPLPDLGRRGDLGRDDRSGDQAVFYYFPPTSQTAANMPLDLMVFVGVDRVQHEGREQQPEVTVP